MERFRYGTKEIIATVCSAALFVLMRHIGSYLAVSGMLNPEVFEWIRPGVVIVTVCAVFFGPVSGMLCAVAGEFLMYVTAEPNISYPRIIAIGLYGFFVGLYFGRTHYDPEDFTPRAFMDFNAIQIMCGIFVTMIFLPLARFIAEDANIYDEITAGVKSLVGCAVTVGIICPIIMGIVCAVLVAVHKKRGT
ncbi:MAG: ECF transporter S component [Lachnospiraceae bacterium]|nr:ECF transporter S component [Lachnospiraceae bacterium]